MRFSGIKLLVFIFLLQGYSSLYAASWYQVEVIVFEHLEADYDGELWHENPGLPDRADSIQLILKSEDSDNTTITTESSDTLMPYKELSEQYYRLEGVERVLKLSREYRPLLHIAWQQPGLGARSTRSVHLENTLFEEDEGQVDITEFIYEEPKIIYDGIIRLRSSHLIHVDVDFSFFPEDFIDKQYELEQPQDNALFNRQYADYVRLTETKRIKLNEIHYFDHPLFGVILQVSRLRKLTNESVSQIQH